ncbi:MAG: hypothetical protein ACOYMG_17235 [Candidatus Methylumidiphilus sp.]
MSGIISKDLRWDGSIIVEPRTFDLLGFFAPREGLRVSGLFAKLLPWIVYTHETSCGRVFADCFDLRRAVPETRLRKELPVGKRFRVFEGLCLVASLVGRQFGGKEGWLRVDGALNVFLLDVGGQILAVSVSCLDNSGEFFIDDWWLLLDRVGPLSAHDRVFSFNPSKSLPRTVPSHPPARDYSAYAPANRPFGTVPVERRSVQREYYCSYGLSGYSLRVYLRRHTVKRFCKGYRAQDNPSKPSGVPGDGINSGGRAEKEGDNPLSPKIVECQNSDMLQGR